jgi:hypothetical protein
VIQPAGSCGSGAEGDAIERGEDDPTVMSFVTVKSGLPCIYVQQADS